VTETIAEVKEVNNAEAAMEAKGNVEYKSKNRLIPS
jgi:hypothetical protein